MNTKFLQVHVRIFVKTVFTTCHFVARTKSAAEWYPNYANANIFPPQAYRC